MKYEIIFGDERLFDGASEFVEVIRFNDYSREYLWGDLNTIQLLTSRELKAIPIVAMRRIIADPKRWTVEDQRAGRLPEVGNYLLTEGSLAEFIGLSHAPNNWCFRRLDGEWGIQAANKDWFSPIETPEEKAARFRKEWCNKAIELAHIHGSSAVEAGAIYDAILSGYLSTPVQAKDGE